MVESAEPTPAKKPTLAESLPGLPGFLRRRPRLWIGLAAAVLAIRITLPLVLEQVIEREGSAALGLQLEIGDLDLSLALGGVTLESLLVGGPQEPDASPEARKESALFACEKLYVELRWLALLGGEIHLSQFLLEQPAVRLERDEQGALISPLPPAPQEQEQEQTESGGALPLTLDHFIARDASLRVVRAQVPSEVPLALDFENLAVDAIALPGEGATFGVGKLALDGATLRWLAAGATQEVGVRVAAEELSDAPGVSFPLSAGLEVGGGEVELEGRAGINPPTYAGALRWEELPLASLLAAGAPELVSWMRSGASEGELELAVGTTPGPAGEPASVHVSGHANVTDLHFADAADENGLAWEALEVTLGSLELPLEGGAPRVELQRVRLARPELKIGLPADSLQALAGNRSEATAAAPSAAAPPPQAAQPARPEEQKPASTQQPPKEPQRAPEASPAPAPAPASAPAPAAAPAVVVAELELTDGRVRFSDRTVEPPQRNELRELTVSARKLRWPERDVESLSLKARGAAGAVLRFDGKLQQGDGQLELALESVGLAPFDAYAQRYAGMRIERGNLSLRSSLALHGDRYDATNDLGLQHLQVASAGGRFEELFGVPLGMALALLRDPRGDIALALPVAGENSGVSVGVGKLVVSALRQALIGALSTPLKAVGAAFQLGLGDSSLALPELACVAGRAELAPGEDARVATLAGLLAERPGLALRVRGRYAAGDRPGVAEQIMTERVRAGASLPPLADSSWFQRRRIAGALGERGQGKPGALSPEDTAALARWVEAVTVPAERLQALGDARAASVRDLLAGDYGIDPARIVLEPASEGSAAVAFGLAPLAGS